MEKVSNTSQTGSLFILTANNLYLILCWQWMQVCVRVCAFLYFATQVDSGAAVRSLFVQGVARSDEVSDISNVDADLQQANNML